MEQSKEEYTEHVTRLTWLLARAKMAEVLLQNGIADVHNDQVGFWTQLAGSPTFLPLYDLLGEFND
jgi:hypothetical protein